jgi:glycosyltransferase involved in cell wall biosynthesis
MSMNKQPIFVTILMPVFNSESFLTDAIESILKQSYANFEFLIVNDGSTDNSLRILNEYKKKDKRIIIHNQENFGIERALNNGISISRGEYIFRMDSDDISTSDRIESQLKFMIANNIDVCGSWAKCFGSSNKIIKTNVFNKDIKTAMFFLSPFVHPTMAFKAYVLREEKYSDTFSHAEDYYLWTRLAMKKIVFGNLPKICLYYRVHNNQVSSKERKIQESSTMKIRKLYYNSVSEKLPNSNIIIIFFCLCKYIVLEINILLYVAYYLKSVIKTRIYFKTLELYHKINM